MSRLRVALAACVVFVAHAREAAAFPHVVQQGESLASIAMRVYGTTKLESVLAAVNALDSQGGSAVVAGMRLELPAPWHHRVADGESWAQLARAYLGDAERAGALARMNDASAWIAPTPGAEIRVPYVMTIIAATGEQTSDLARRYLGDAKRAWEIHTFNALKDRELSRGQVVLVPLVDLTLTADGKADAVRAAGLDQTQGGGGVLDAQKRVAGELPELLAEVRSGRWVEAVARGNRLLAAPELSRGQLAAIHRSLTTAYAALGASEFAAAACVAWRREDAGAAVLDPVSVSPKIRAVCK